MQGLDISVFYFIPDSTLLMSGNLRLCCKMFQPPNMISTCILYQERKMGVEGENQGAVRCGVWVIFLLLVELWSGAYHIGQCGATIFLPSVIHDLSSSKTLLKPCCHLRTECLVLENNVRLILTSCIKIQSNLSSRPPLLNSNLSWMASFISLHDNLSIFNLY